MKDAVQLAELDVLTVANEPTAAALAYGIDKIEGAEDRLTLIIDLGGRTFDTTLLCMDSGILEVKSTNGDKHLGGADFDQELVDFCCQQFENETGIDCRKDVKAMRRLKTECEKTKICLSAYLEVELACDALKDGEDFQFIFTR